MAIVEQSSFDGFNEDTCLVEVLNSYKERFGYYPEYALVHKIYLTRVNRKFMKKNDIKHTGSPLGCPKLIDKGMRAKMKKEDQRKKPYRRKNRPRETEIWYG